MGLLIPDEPYDAPQVIDLCKALQSQPGFNDRQGVMENWYDLRWRKMPVNILGISGKLESRTPGIAANVDRYRNRMFSAPITISVAPKSTDPKDKTAAQHVENYFYRSFHDFAAEPTEEEALDYQSWAGCGIRHVEWSSDALALLRKLKRGSDKEIADTVVEGVKKGFDGNPFEIIVPHPEQVYWEPDLSTVAEVGVVKVRTAVQSFQEHEAKIIDLVSAVAPDADRNIWNTMLNYYHLETEEFIYTVLGSEDHSHRVEVRPNPAHRPRYSLAAGHLTSSNLPHEKYRPLVHDLYSVAQKMNIADTLLMSGMLAHGRPLYQEVSDGAKGIDAISILSDTSGERRVISIDLSQGKMPASRRGMHWEPLAAPTPDQLKEAMARLDREWNRYSFPVALSPEASELDAKSGYDRSQQEDVAVDFLNPALLNRARAWKKTFLLMATMLQETKMPVRLRAVPFAEGLSRDQRVEMTVQPTDFEDIDLVVTFSSKSRTALFGEREEMFRRFQLNLISRSTLMGELYDDPIEEDKKIALDQMAQAGQQMAMQFAMSAIQVLQPADMQALLAQQAQQPTNGVPQDGGPSEPGGIREARPAGEGASVPGLGSPVVPPQQAEPGQ